MIFRKFCKNKNGTELKRGAFLSIILSSAIFGGAHLVNLFAGADVGATILQVGYSFLIGSMFALAAVKSGNFYHAVALHAIFDFGGLLESKGLIEGVIWTTENMILTAAVGLIVCVYAIVLFIKNKKTRHMPCFLYVHNQLGPSAPNPDQGTFREKSLGPPKAFAKINRYV